MWPYYGLDCPVCGLDCLIFANLALTVLHVQFTRVLGADIGDVRTLDEELEVEVVALGLGGALIILGVDRLRVGWP